MSKSFNKEEYVQKQEAEKTEFMKNINAVVDGWHEKPETIADSIAFAARFYQYSLNNTVAIRRQNRFATYIASFNAWKQQGYAVNKGEKGLKILVPATVTLFKRGDEVVQLKFATKEEKEKIKTGTIKTWAKTSFKLGTVFDIAQTNCPIEDYPKLYNMGYADVERAALVESLSQYSKDVLGCTVFFENLSSISLRGLYHSDNNSISLNEKLNDSEALSTLIHELGHAIMQHGIDNEDNISTVQKELEADLFSLMLQSRIGIPVEDNRARHLATHYKEFRKTKDENKGKKDFNAIVDKVLKQFPKVWEDIEKHVQIEQHYHSEIPGNPNLSKQFRMLQEIGKYEDRSALNTEDRLSFFVNDHHVYDKRDSFQNGEIENRYEELQNERSGFVRNTRYLVEAKTDDNLTATDMYTVMDFGEVGSEQEFYLLDHTKNEQIGVPLSWFEGKRIEVYEEKKQFSNTDIGDVIRKNWDSLQMDAYIPQDVIMETKPSMPPQFNTIVVGCYAGPGAGKTTTAWALAAALKQHGLNVEYVPEYAKELVWDGRLDLLDGTIASQRIITEEQNRRIDRLIGKVPVIVTDSPILLRLMYCNENEDKADIKAFTNEVLQKYNSYNNFNLFIERKKDYEPAGRVQSLEESVALDKEILSLLEQHNVIYGTYKQADVESIANSIVGAVKVFNESPTAPTEVEQWENNSIESISMNEVPTPKIQDMQKEKPQDQTNTETGAAPKKEENKPKQATKKERQAEYQNKRAAARSIPITTVIEGCGYTLTRAGNLYSTKEHDSMRIYPDTNSYYRNSTQQGGTAIDFLVNEQGMSVNDAIERLASMAGYTPNSTAAPRAAMKKVEPVTVQDKEKPHLRVSVISSSAYSTLKDIIAADKLEIPIAPLIANDIVYVAHRESDFEEIKSIIGRDDVLYYTLISEQEIEERVVAAEKAKTPDADLLSGTELGLPAFEMELQDFSKTSDEMRKSYAVDWPKLKQEVYFVLPPKAENNKRVFAYLCSRGLEPKIINSFIKRGLLYESADKHNCVFVGKSKKGLAHSGIMRGTYTKGKTQFKGNVKNSNKEYGVCVENKDGSNAVCCFEAPIDMMSFMQLRNTPSHKIAFGSVDDTALPKFLEAHPEVEKICFCFDNDEVNKDGNRPGVDAANKLVEKYADKGYETHAVFPPAGKDWNQWLEIQGKANTGKQESKVLDEVAEL